VVAEETPRQPEPVSRGRAPVRLARGQSGAAFRPREATGQLGSFVRLLPITEHDLGSIRVARVRLPGQAVRALGLEAQPTSFGTAEFVEADVLLGEDGMARAIRVVEESSSN
jgi:hypothetical protein